MARDAVTAGLYDFLYRDSARIASYYAQLFGSYLSGVEETDSESTVEDKGARVNAAVAAGEVKHSSGITSSTNSWWGSKSYLQPRSLCLVSS